MRFKSNELYGSLLLVDLVYNTQVCVHTIVCLYIVFSIALSEWPSMAWQRVNLHGMILKQDLSL